MKGCLEMSDHRLTDELILDEWDKAYRAASHMIDRLNPAQSAVHHFARAVEREVRRRCAEIARQHNACSLMGGHKRSDGYRDTCNDVISTAIEKEGE
jgi:hypothetical protein